MWAQRGSNDDSIFSLFYVILLLIFFSVTAHLQGNEDLCVFSATKVDLNAAQRELLLKLLSGITKLEHLNLSHIGLQDQDLNHIQGWTPNVLHTLDLRANQLTSLPQLARARDRKWVVVGGGGCLCLAGGESGAVERGMACEGVGREGARSSPTTLHIAQSFIESRVRAYGPEPCQVLHEGGEEEEGGDRDWLFCCAGRGTGPAAAPGRGTQSVPVRAPRVSKICNYRANINTRSMVIQDKTTAIVSHVQTQYDTHFELSNHNNLQASRADTTTIK
eukprot:g63872.t1